IVSSNASWLCGAGILLSAGTKHSKTLTLPFESTASTRNLTLIAPTWIVSCDPEPMPSSRADCAATWRTSQYRGQREATASPTSRLLLLDGEASGASIDADTAPGPASEAVAPSPRPP